jgi:hypothetical protein
MILLLSYSFQNLSMSAKLTEVRNYASKEATGSCVVFWFVIVEYLVYFKPAPVRLWSHLENLSFHQSIYYYMSNILRYSLTVKL